MIETITDEVETESSKAWRVYAIVPAGAALADLPAGTGDLDGRSLEVLTCDEIGAVVEPIDPDRPVGRKDLIAHSDLLNGLIRTTPVVPVAFGSAFTERDQVAEELLQPHHDQLLHTLDRLRGHAQFLLRGRYFMDELLAEIVSDDQRIAGLRERTRDLADGEGESEKLELGAQVSRAVDDRLAADADWLAGRLRPFCVDLLITGTSSAQGSTSVAFLVADAHRPDFEAEAERCAERMQSLATLSLQGPLAPFDFAQER